MGLRSVTRPQVSDIDPTRTYGETYGSMGILTRYILAELIKVFLLSLVALTVLILVVGVVREAVSQNLPLVQVVRLVPYILPDALRMAVPATLLLATTVVYGRLSNYNEVVAAKSLGISPMALLWPTLVAAFLISLVTVWLNDLAVSWGRLGAQRVVLEAVEEIAYNMLKSQGGYSSPRFSINVRRVEERRLFRPTITLPATDDSPPMTITAEWAELRSDHAAGVLKIVLYNGTLTVGDKVRAVFPGKFERDIPLRDASRAKNLSESTSCKPLREIGGETLRQRERIEQHRQMLAAQAACQMFCGDFDRLTSAEWNWHAQHHEKLDKQLCRLLLEPHRRWSAGFSCFFFALVGAPMAIRLSRSDFWTVFFLCFLPILIVYYPLLIYGISGAKNGTIPPQSIWSGNVLLLIWGVWLLRKVIRY